MGCQCIICHPEPLIIVPIITQGNTNDQAWKTKR